MPDHLTDEERQLVDEAIAAGQVQHIPRGVSGFGEDGEPLKLMNPWRERQMARANKRRDKVVKLVEEGHTFQEMAEILNASIDTIRVDVKNRLGENGWARVVENRERKEAA